MLNSTDRLRLQSASPFHANLFGKAVNLLSLAGDAAGALTAIDEFLQKETDSLIGRTTRAEALERLGRISEASLELKDVVARDPRRATECANLAGLLCRLGDVDGAKRYLDLTKGHVHTRAEACGVLINCGLLDYALGEATKARATWRDLGEQARNTGTPEAAVARALILATTPQGHLRRGVAEQHLRLGDIDASAKRCVPALAHYARVASRHADLTRTQKLALRASIDFAAARFIDNPVAGQQFRTLREALPNR